jgi:hypothetical protein
VHHSNQSENRSKISKKSLDIQSTEQKKRSDVDTLVINRQTSPLSTLSGGTKIYKGTYHKVSVAVKVIQYKVVDLESILRYFNDIRQ